MPTQKSRHAHVPTSTCAKVLVQKSFVCGSPRSGIRKNFVQQGKHEFEYSLSRRSIFDACHVSISHSLPCCPHLQGTDGATYADQQKVFDDLGQGVLNNAYQGFNSW